MAEEATSKRKSDSVRSLVRGLAVLRQVNAAGQTSAGEIAKDTGIPRPTVYRLLETLEEEGYVALSPTTNRVRATRLAAALGDGYTVTSRLCQAAGPLFSEYAPRIVWPLDLSIYDNAAMVIQETTHGRSPLSIDRGMIGYRLPVLRSSAGRCYLGHCSSEERRLILEHIRQMNDPADAFFLIERNLQSMLSEVAECGYSSRNAGGFRPHTSSVAFPVLVNGSAMACVSMIWIRSAMTVQQAIETCEGSLREIAQRLSAMLERS